MDGINNQLRALYAENWSVFAGKLDAIVTSDQAVKPTNPLLLYVEDEEQYLHADIRLMVFGQETNDWGNDFKGDIASIQSIYQEFFSTGRCFKYVGQFWNGVGRFIKMLEESSGEQKISFLWNNLIKVGKSGMKGKPPEYIYQVEREFFDVIRREIEILKPHLLVFLTGPYYDTVIRERLDVRHFKGLGTYRERQLASFALEGVACAMRTYHPNYLWRKGINTYYNAMLHEIGKNIDL